VPPRLRPSARVPKSAYVLPHLRNRAAVPTETYGEEAATPATTTNSEETTHDSSNGFEPVYTPPSSNEYNSPPANKRRPEVSQPRNTMARATKAFEITNEFRNLSIRHEQVSRDAAAVEQELEECEAALRSIPSSLPNANSYRADLQDRLAFLRNRYETAKDKYLERLDYTVRSPGIDLEEPLSSDETYASHGAATFSANKPAGESKDGRPTKTFTSPPAQTELRTLEELRRVNFYTLTKEEKARVLLPLLTKTHPETGNLSRPGPSQHPEEVASLKDQVGSRQAASSKAGESTSQGYARHKSSPKAFTDVLHEISKRSVGTVPGSSHAIPHLSPSTQFSSLHKTSARIEKALQSPSPKLRAFDQTLNDLKKFSVNFRLTTPVPADLISILSKTGRTHNRVQPKLNRDNRDEEPRDDALHPPYVMDDEVISARLAEYLKHAKEMQSTLHDPNAFDRPYVVDDPELSEMLSKVSFREGASRNGQVPDEDKPDWFEGLVQDGDDEVYVGDPSSSPWQSQKQSDSDAHGGGQSHCASRVPSILGRSFRPAAEPISKAPKPSEDEAFKFGDIPAPLLGSLLQQPATVLAQNRTPLLTQSLHRLNSVVAQVLEPKSTILQPLDRVHKMLTEGLEQGSVNNEVTSARLARHLESNTTRQPEPFVPLSSIDHSVRDSTKFSDGRSEQVSDGFAETPQRHPRWMDFNTTPSVHSGSTAKRVSSNSAQEMTNSNHRDSSEADSAAASSRCDSCGSTDVDFDAYGVYCGACGIYTEQPMMSHERVGNDYREKTGTSGWGAPLASGDSNCSWGPTTHKSADSAAPWAGTWSVRDSVTDDCGGWSERDAGEVGDGWGAPSLVDASEPVDQDNVRSPHVWTMEQDEDLLDQKARFPMRSWARIADDIGLLTCMIKDPAYVCEVRFELLKSEQQERKLTKKEKKQLPKQKKQPKEVKQTNAKKQPKQKKQRKDKKEVEEKQYIEAHSGDVADTATHDTWFSSDAKDTVFEFDPPDMPKSFWYNGNSARAGKDCWEGSVNADEKLSKGSVGNDIFACTKQGHAHECWMAGYCVRKGNFDTWGQGPKSRQSSPAPSGRAFCTTSKPAEPVPNNYTVTYWATVECDDQTIHIPIDDNNISGPEKTILNGPAKKVWKWVQEKGLGGKVGLQDAFDLAQDLYGDDKEDACAACPPKSAPAPSLCEFRSPATAERFIPPDYESAEVGHLCWGCGEPRGWCTC
jgi:hypothetical protein